MSKIVASVRQMSSFKCVLDCNYRDCWLKSQPVCAAAAARADMHILFVDESGTPSKPDAVEKSYFVVGAAIVPEHSWHPLRDALLGLKARFGIRGEIKWRYFAPGNDESRNPMRGLDAATRNEIRSAIYKIVAKDKSIRTLAAICSPKAAYALPHVEDQGDIYHLAYKAVTERFQFHLQDISAPGRRELGIVVCDHRGTQDDKRLRAHHEKLLHSGAEFVANYKNLVEGLFLQPSNLSIGIQIADLVAGAVWRAYQKQDTQWFDLVKPTLRRSHTGEVNGYGLVKVPKFNWE